MQNTDMSVVQICTDHIQVQIISQYKEETLT